MKKSVLFILIMNGVMLSACAQEKVKNNIDEKEIALGENKNVIFELNFDSAEIGGYTKQKLLEEDGIEDLHFYFVSFNQHK